MKLNGYTWDGEDGKALEIAVAKSKASGCGIAFGGAVGSGKTTAAKALASNYVKVECWKPERIEWLDDWKEWALPGRDIILDDMGREPLVNDFGVKRNAVAAFILDLDNARNEKKWLGRLFVTTNLSGKEMVEQYDEATISRLKSMCVMCGFKENRRASAGDVLPPSTISVPPLPPPPPTPTPRLPQYPIINWKNRDKWDPYRVVLPKYVEEFSCLNEDAQNAMLALWEAALKAMGYLCAVPPKDLTPALKSDVVHDALMAVLEEALVYCKSTYKVDEECGWAPAHWRFNGDGEIEVNPDAVYEDGAEVMPMSRMNGEEWDEWKKEHGCVPPPRSLYPPPPPPAGGYHKTPPKPFSPMRHEIKRKRPEDGAETSGAE